MNNCQSSKRKRASRNPAFEGIPYGVSKQKSTLSAATRQVRGWFRSANIKPPLKQREMFLLFLQLNGVERDEAKHISWQVGDLFADESFGVIGRMNACFYSSPEWKKLRNGVLSKYGQVCMACGGTEYIAVDHIMPRSIYPSLELDPDNMQVLCKSCNSKKGNRKTTDYRSLCQRLTGNRPQ